jgi:uncharacterized protein
MTAKLLFGAGGPGRRLALIAGSGLLAAWDQAPRSHVRYVLRAGRGDVSRTRAGAGPSVRSDALPRLSRPPLDREAGLIVEALEARLHDAAVPDARVRRASRAVATLLGRAVRRADDGMMHVISGDIPAMWLRDAAAQVAPLLAVSAEVPGAADLVRGVLHTQVEQVLIDPRANAFNAGPTGFRIRRDVEHQSAWVFERKYALDSLCAPLTLAWRLYRWTGSTQHLDARFREAAEAILAVWREGQDHDRASYVLRRRLARREDSLSHGGHGAPLGHTGMTWSGFRPSDDACVYGYHVPANALAAVSLARLAALLEAVGERSLAAEARALSDEIRHGIETHAIVETPDMGRIYAYEVDGLGHAVLLDDANIPSSLSLPYLGYSAEGDPVYRATRAWALSRHNPCWSRGQAVRGVGSSHTRRGWVWPMAIIMEGLTTQDDDERETALRRVEATAGRDGSLHESVHPADPSRFTRRWFSWADMLYVELVLRTAGIDLRSGAGSAQTIHGVQPPDEARAKGQADVPQAA